ncbi:MAG TPA: lamin tail domain-containing protein [Phycisphaerae bacterium]|nr:lamin tail domain-containing protein [Phycisphaerae bacterium]
MRYLLMFGLVVSLVQVASGGMVISEWMYAGTNGEFVEFTNIGPDPVDMTDWSYSDTDAEPFDVMFGSTFGVVQPGESVILTEVEPSAFRTAWGLNAGVKIFGPNTDSNLGRNDMINLYDAAGLLIDTLSYGDQTYPGTVRTNGASCNIPGTDYGYTVVRLKSEGWLLAWVGDEFGSWASTGGDVGTPGIAPIPEPTTLMLFAFCGLAVARRRVSIR